MLHRLKFFLADKPFWNTLFVLALPMALQNLISTSMNLTDNLMVGQLGEHAIGALALANQVTFLVILVSYAVSSGAGIFASQYWGAGNLAGVRQTQGLCASIAVAIATAFAVVTVWIPESIMALYTEDLVLRRLGAEYLRISAFAFPLTALSFSVAQVLRSTANALIPLVVSIVALLVNVVLNTWLIFGGFGVPALGVAGSAIGTLIARAVEAAGLVAVCFVRRTPNVGSWSQLFSWPADFLKRYLKTTVPVLGNDVGWALGMTSLTAVYARIGSTELASFSIADTVVQFMNIVLFSSVNAAAIMVGNAIGSRSASRPRVLANRFVFVSIGLGLLSGIALYGLSFALPWWFNVSDRARETAQSLIVVLAFYIGVKSYLYHMTVGLFRGGGDTNAALVLELGGLWLIAVPSVFVAAFVFHLPMTIVFLIAGFQEVVVSIFSTARLRSGKWIRNVAHA